MNLKSLTTSALALGFVIPATGCFETITGPYDGPDVVEFAQFAGSADPYTRAVSEDAGSVDLTVNLISANGAATSDLTIQVSVDGSSTAGTSDYSFANGPQVTIPAGSTSGTLTINIADDADVDGAETIVMELTGTADGSVVGAENFDDFTVTIVDND